MNYTFSLPVKIGLVTYKPTAYMVSRPDGSRYPFAEITKSKVSMLQQKSDGTWKFRANGSDWTLDDIGKSIFLDQKEAEKELNRLLSQL